MTPELHGKILTWLRDNGYIGNLLKTLRVKIKPTVPLKDEVHKEVDVDGNDVTATESDIPNDVPVKSVPPRRRTKSDIQVVKNDKVVCTSMEMVNNVPDKYGSDLTNGEGCSNKDSSNGIEKVIILIRYIFFSCISSLFSLEWILGQSILYSPMFKI